MTSLTYLEQICEIIMAVSFCGLLAVGVLARTYEARIRQDHQTIRQLMCDLNAVSNLARDYYRANRDMQRRLELAGALLAGVMAGREGMS